MALTVLDAGVVIGVFDGRDAHHAAAVNAVRDARARRDDLVLPASAYAEILVQPMREGSEAVRSVDAGLDALRIRVEPATREIAARAASLRARHGRKLRLPDALVIATAEVVRARRLLTSDAELRNLSPIVVLVG